MPLSLQDLKSKYIDNDNYSEEEYEKLFRYLDLSYAELQSIVPCWAVDELVNHLQDYSLHPDMDEYMFVTVSPRHLISHLYILGLDTDVLFTGDFNDYRYITTLERWAAHLPVDPPTVSISLNSIRKLSMSDGRHRLLLAHYLGVELMPVAVSKGLQDEVIQILAS